MMWLQTAHLCQCSSLQTIVKVLLYVCSAGVGRTGVFITLSIVLERMRYEGAVDIFQTVKMLRTQRPAMVQTEVNTDSLHMAETQDSLSMAHGHAAGKHWYSISIS